MGFRFIHTADWQLGKSFGRFSEARAGELRSQRQEVITRIADVARSRGAGHVVVAGDVWDTAIPGNATLRQPLSIMGAAGDVTWWLLPGNHDPDGADGLWDRVEALAPENVKLLRDSAPVEAEPGVWFLPAPWRRIQHGADLTDWMAGADTPDGDLRIGIAHGSVPGFAPEGEVESRQVIPRDRAATARLDYLALGDWHGRTAVDTRTHYSGTPEPDRHKAGARGQVLAVTVEVGSEPDVEEVPTAHFDWPVVRADFVPDNTLPTLDEVRTALREGQPLHRTLARIEVSGEVTVAEWNAFEDFMAEMTGECAALELRGDSAVKLVVVPEDIDALDAQGSVREAAESLKARMEDADLSREDRNVAADALRLLLRYGREEVA